MKTRETLVRFAVIAALGAFAFGGCKKEREPVTAAAQPTPAYGTPSYGTPTGTGMTGTGTPTGGGMGGGPVDVNSAVNRIADARCEREMTCGNIGGDKKFVDRVTCVSEAKKDSIGALSRQFPRRLIEQRRPWRTRIAW